MKYRIFFIPSYRLESQTILAGTLKGGLKMPRTKNGMDKYNIEPFENSSMENIIY